VKLFEPLQMVGEDRREIIGFMADQDGLLTRILFNAELLPAHHSEVRFEPSLLDSQREWVLKVRDGVTIRQNLEAMFWSLTASWMQVIIFPPNSDIYYVIPQLYSIGNGEYRIVPKGYDPSVYIHRKD
jgi:hypothetical protein